MSIKKAYTLVEILLVIGIVLILSTVVLAIVNPTAQRQRANDSVIKKAVGEIAAAIEVFKAAQGRYPTESDVSYLQAYISNAYTVYNAGSLIGFNNPDLNNGSATNSIYWDPSASDGGCLQSPLTEKTGTYAYWIPGQPVTSGATNCSALIVSAPSTDSGPPDSGSGNIPAPPVSSEYNQASGNPKALVGYYKMDEASGTTMADSSSKSNHGTVTAGVTRVPGIRGNAIKIPTNNDYGYVPNMLGSPRSATMSFWVNPLTVNQSASGSGGDVVSIADNLAVRINTNQIYGFYHTGTTWLTTSYNTQLLGKSWVHIAFVFDDAVTNTQKLFVNGNLVSTTNHSSSIVYKGLGTGTTIGRHGNVTYNAYDLQGRVDEVRIYNYARTNQQILDEYNDTKLPSVPNPLAYLKFDENSGSTAADSIGTNTGTLGAGTAAPTWNSGQIGNALTFDGTNDYVSLGDKLDPAAGSSLSISVWVKPTNVASTGHQRIIVKDNTTTGWAISLGDIAPGSGRIRFFTRGVGVTITDSPTVLQNNRWYHVVAVFDNTANTKTIYIDGVSTIVHAAQTGDIQQTAHPLALGRDPTGVSGNPFFGQIDEMRIFNYALTSAQVDAEYRR